MRGRTLGISGVEAAVGLAITGLLVYAVGSEVDWKKKGPKERKKPKRRAKKKKETVTIKARKKGSGIKARKKGAGIKARNAK